MVARVTAAMLIDPSSDLPRPFLDVTASALGRPWRERCMKNSAATSARYAPATTMTKVFKPRIRRR
jgi:hypothetical protein